MSIVIIRKTEQINTRLRCGCSPCDGASTSNSKSSFRGQLNLLNVLGGSKTRSSSSGNGSFPKIELPVAAKFC